MLGFFKKDKEIIVNSPLNGEVTNLNNVPDKTFTSNIIGEGVAIIPEDGSIHAPLDCSVEIFKTNHLLIFEPKKGVYVVLHFGVGTSLLGGEGFERIVEFTHGKNVKSGEELVKYDLDYINKNAKSSITPFIVSNEKVSKVEILVPEGQKVKVGEPLLKITLK
ncbi:PTS system, glucose-specific IIA component [Cetobacterium ceti]|uniref:PTS system, glucose-specific IIA component n=1 Tax=Cetobacterium ceti TaxID=180163 RepID=A0A1T4M9I4_9FUSO|nr:glucose PTS transporter subunit IIA [Cetobacterium ceti]SJZ63592.1 PTS system, glucose-specific IIA component [Cetobacterium ceti]